MKQLIKFFQGPCYTMQVNSQSTIDELEALKPELSRAGIAALYLFGSYARGDMRQDSDIDLAFDVDDAHNETFSLIDQAGLQMRLESQLGRKVDFLERRALHRDLRPRIERDMVRIF